MSEPRSTAPEPTASWPTAVTPASVTGDLPDGLLEAFTGYEDALARNDLAALDAFFAPGESTLRGDATGLLVGHDAISGFRGARIGTLARGIRSLHVRVIDPRHAVIVSVNTPDAGGAGLVTQLWVLGESDSWRVEVAQVAAPPAAVNPTVWRLVGTPLVPAATDTGPLAFALDSTWALPTTAAALLAHAMAALQRRSDNHVVELSERCDRHVYVRGLTVRRGFMLTIGNVVNGAGADV